MAGLLVGLIAGLLGGLVGVGGGSFMIPMMVIFAGIAQHTAQGISLLAMIPASAVGVWTHWQEGKIRTSRLPGLVAGVLAGVYVGATFAHLIPDRELRLLYTTAFAICGQNPSRRLSARKMTGGVTFPPKRIHS